MGKSDTCYYVQTELKSTTVDKYNNILIEFTRAVSMNNTNDSGLIIQIHTKDGSTKGIEWYILPISMPSSYIYIITNVTDTIQGGAY